MNEKKIKQDIRRDGPTVQKILQLFRLFRPKNTKTLAKLKHFTDIDIKKIFEESGVRIKGLIIDVDDCIAPNRKNILKINIDYLKKLKGQGIKMVIYSNRKWAERIGQIEDQIDFLYTKHPKPDKRGFNEALKHLKLKANEVAMVGDSYITDGGAIQSGIHFILIKAIHSENKKLIHKIIMPPYGLIRTFYNSLSALYDNMFYGGR